MNESYDFIIVGTGFASSFFLKRLLERCDANARIAVLERGALYSHSRRLSIRANSFSEYQSTLKGFDSYHSSSDKPWLFDPNFGGSSNCWTGCTPRFMPDDFKMNTTYGVGVDWPISYDDLDGYYDQAEDIMDIAGPSVTPFPKNSKYKLPPHKLSELDEMLQSKYGSLYISQPAARRTVAAESRNACCSSAVCNLCPVDAKLTIENTFGNLYEDSRVTLIYDAQVLNLNLSSDAVRSVEYRKAGMDHTLIGETVVLGANAIFNAHILLNSGDSSKFIGSGICEQAGTFVRLYFNGLNNVGASSVISANGYMGYSGKWRSNYSGSIIENWNTPFIRNEMGRWREMALMKFIFEDLPSEGNYVAASDDITKPNIVFSGYSDYVTKALDKLRDNVDEMFSFLPIERVELDGYLQKTEGHICSTTRMSSNKDQGVVDGNMIHHVYRNLLVLGSSVYPTVTPSNPTLTLSALSLRAADRYLT